MDHIVNQFIPEDIALLSLLCDVPEEATKNVPSLEIRNVDPGRRALTFERERDIVDNLAFISAIDEDPNKVIAVCIEEVESANGLKVILAVNRGNLATVKHGLVRLFDILKDGPQVGEPLKENDKIKANLLKEIVSLNTNRLLCRLRSRHAKSTFRKRDKPPLDTNLTHVLRLSRRVLAKNHWVVDTVKACERFQALSRGLEEANATQTHGVLINIVKCAHEITTRFQLERLLSLLPRDDSFDPLARESLLSRMQKVGRYQSTCDFLFSVARRTTVFEKVEVEVVKLPMLVSTKPQPLDLAPNLTATIKRGGLNDAENIERLCRGLRRKREYRHLAFSRAEEVFERRLRDIRSSARVHAEIQVIYHYERKPPRIRPRVICSSKSACFLCNLFVRIHGKFHIERTHGRLYEKWKLPAMSPLQIPQPGRDTLLAVLESFDNQLKNAIRVFLLQQQPKRLAYRHPNESLFVPPPTWTPSVISEVINDKPVIGPGPSEGSTTPTPTIKLPEQPDTPRDDISELKKDHESQKEPDDQSDQSAAFDGHLERGKRINSTLSRSNQNLHFESPFFHIIAESFIPNLTETRENNNKPSEKVQRGSIEIEWLDEQEEARIRNEKKKKKMDDVVDVESMRRGEEMTTSQGSPMASEGLYISFKRGMVYVRYISADF